MSIQSLTTKRLILRGIQLSDAPSYARHFADYEVIRTLSGTVPWPYPEKGVEDFIEQVLLPNQGKEFWAWGLFLKTSPDEMIGGLTLRIGGPKGNRGFWLGRKFWGRGLMSEAAEVTLDYAFEELGFEILNFQNAVGNTASRKIKEATGAKLVGIKPGKYGDPVLTQSEYWELSKEAWVAHRVNL